MPMKPDEGLPEAGDWVEYYHPSRGKVCLQVRWVEDPSPSAGYSNIWFEGCFGPTFNINWTTLNANTGSWKIVSKKAPKPREFKMPPEPKDVKRVQALDGSDEVYTFDGRVWRDRDRLSFTWRDIHEEHPDGVIEVLLDAYEEAIEFFRSGAKLDEAAPLDAFSHARVIIEKVVNDG